MIQIPRVGSTATEIPWIETEATVTTCGYEFGAGRALAFGLPSSKHFRISYTYRAQAKTYTGEFSSAHAIAQGESIPLSYNPLAPQQNSRSNSTAPQLGRGPLLAIGVVGSVTLSLLWLTFMHGCS